MARNLYLSGKEATPMGQQRETTTTTDKPATETTTTTEKPATDKPADVEIGKRETTT